MIHFRAPLLGGVFSIGLMLPLIGTDIVHAATLVEAPGRHDAAALVRLAANDTPAWAAEATMNPDYTASESATPDQNSGAATAADSNNASGSTPAWDAPAKMNPDYTNEPSTEPAAAGAGEQAAPTEDKASTAEEAAPPPTGGQATTEYFGDKASSESPAWDAPAKMNPDYAKDESAAPAATEAPAAEAAEEPAPPPTGGKATTEFFGGSESQGNPAWAEPATMNPDYNAATPAASESAASSTAGACIETVTADAKGIQVHFSEDSAAIAQDGRSALTNLAKSLKDCGGVTVEVQGYTDTVGSEGSNKVLSELRAKKVVDFLTSAGVDSSKLKAVGYGPEKAIGDNHTAEGRRLNRRVELVVSSQ